MMPMRYFRREGSDVMRRTLSLLSVGPTAIAPIATSSVARRMRPAVPAHRASLIQHARTRDLVSHASHAIGMRRFGCHGH